jgi:hypothetical protein
MLVEFKHASASNTPPTGLVVEAITSTAMRLKSLLEEENAILESKTAGDHQPFIDKKNQILRELLVHQRTHSNIAGNPDLLGTLRDVRALVDRNHALLQAHVAAMTDVTKLLTQAAAHEESDGTYSRGS